MIRLNLKLIISDIRIYTRRIQFDAFVYSWYFTSYIYFSILCTLNNDCDRLVSLCSIFQQFHLGSKQMYQIFDYIWIFFITFGFPLLHSDFLYYIRISFITFGFRTILIVSWVGTMWYTLFCKMGKLIPQPCWLMKSFHITSADNQSILLLPVLTNWVSLVRNKTAELRVYSPGTWAESSPTL